MERGYQTPEVKEINIEDYNLRKIIASPSMGQLALFEVEHEPPAA